MIRFTLFASIIFIFTLLENLFPRKKERELSLKRFCSHMALVGLGALLINYLIPVKAVDFAPSVEFSLSPFVVLRFLSEFILLDLLIYIQHVVSHRVDIFWKFHAVHHSDKILDSSSAIRFHPLEFLVSMTLKLIFVYFMKISIESFILFEIALSSFALFNHANLKLPEALDRVLKKVIVTPDFHRVHHSVISKEMNSNYGTIFVFWDKLFKTYTDKNYFEQKDLKLGIDKVEKLTFVQLLIFPIKKVLGWAK